MSFAFALLATVYDSGLSARTAVSKLPPIATDRPSFTDLSSLAGLGVWRVESGATYQQLAKNSLSTVGEVTLRRQVSSNLEFRAINVGFATYRHGGSGLEDPAIGFKYRFQTGSGRRPELTFELISSFPIGSSGVKTNAFQPTAKLLWTQAFGPIWSLSGNVVYSHVGAGSTTFDQWLGSLYLAETMSAKTSTYYEIYGEDKQGQGMKGAGFGDVGLEQLLSNNIQVDLRIGSGFNQNENGWFVGAGFSWRF